MARNGRLAEHSGRGSGNIKTRGRQLFFESHALFPISVNFIYKMLYAPAKPKDGRYASFYTFVKNFLSAIVFQRSGGWPSGSQRTNAGGRFAASLPFAFTQTWLASTIYEDKVT